MIEVKIHKDYYLTSDTYNYMLSKKNGTYKTKSGKTRPNYNHLSYHNTISGVLESFRREYVRAKSIKSYKELKQAINEVSECMEEIRKELKE